MASENYRAPSVAQSAELAEQQGAGVTDAEIDSRLNALHRRMKASGQHNGGMVGVAWDRAVYRAALAATGKQQVGGPDGWAFKVIDGKWAVSNPCCGLSKFLHAPDLHTWSCEKSWQPVAASPEQVGEVQGNALQTELLEHAANLERMAADDRETGESIEQAVESGEGYTPDDAVDVAAGLQHGANSAEETAAILRKAAVALAARQPGAQVPVASVEFINGHAAELVFTGAALPDGQHALYAAPPAQGIDLGQLRVLAEQWKQLEYPFSYEGQQAQRAADACRADLLALIDRSDAAPGVDRG